MLIISACSITTNDEIILKENKAPKKEESYFKKSKIEISPIEDYEISFLASERFNIDNNINGINVSHKLLPIPSVVKISDPENPQNFLIARNIRANNDFRFSISNEVSKKLGVNTNIYIEYLKQESINLRKVEDSKEESKIKIDSTSIYAEVLEDGQSGISSKLDYSKIENLEAKSNKYKDMILIDIFSNLNDAKLKTNKIKNLGLIIEEIEGEIFVFTGPFNNNDINLKLDFLIKNGYQNAKYYP